MANIQLVFPKINASLQVGDQVYVVPQLIENFGFTVGNMGNSYLLGYVLDIKSGVDSNGLLPGTQTTVDDVVIVASEPFNLHRVNVESGDNTQVPTTNDYMFFVKDERVNLSSLVGSYGEAKFTNTSREPAEMFTASCEITESSK